MGKVARAAGHEVVELDIDPEYGLNFVVDIFNADYTFYARGTLAFAWTSPKVSYTVKIATKQTQKMRILLQ